MDKKRKSKDRRILLMFLLFFPSIMLVALSGVSNIVIRFGLQVLVLMYQFVVIRNTVYEYYGGEE